MGVNDLAHSFLELLLADALGELHGIRQVIAHGVWACLTFGIYTLLGKAEPARLCSERFLRRGSFLFVLKETSEYLVFNTLDIAVRNQAAHIDLHAEALVNQHSELDA